MSGRHQLAKELQRNGAHSLWEVRVMQPSIFPRGHNRRHSTLVTPFAQPSINRIPILPPFSRIIHAHAARYYYLLRRRTEQTDIHEAAQKNGMEGGSSPGLCFPDHGVLRFNGGLPNVHQEDKKLRHSGKMFTGTTFSFGTLAPFR